MPSKPPRTKFFLDTEFIEFPGTLQLVSIGLVSEHGRARVRDLAGGEPVRVPDRVPDGLEGGVRRVAWARSLHAFHRCES